MKKISNFLYKYIQIPALMTCICLYFQGFKGYDLWPFCLFFSLLLSLAMWPFNEEQKKWKNKSKFKSLNFSILMPIALMAQYLLSQI